MVVLPLALGPSAKADAALSVSARAAVANMVIFIADTPSDQVQIWPSSLFRPAHMIRFVAGLFPAGKLYERE